MNRHFRLNIGLCGWPSECRHQRAMVVGWWSASVGGWGHASSSWKIQSTASVEFAAPTVTCAPTKKLERGEIASLMFLGISQRPQTWEMRDSNQLRSAEETRENQTGSMGDPIASCNLQHSSAPISFSYIMLYVYIFRYVYIYPQHPKPWKSTAMYQ